MRPLEVPVMVLIQPMLSIHQLAVEVVYTVPALNRGRVRLVHNLCKRQEKFVSLAHA